MSKKSAKHKKAATARAEASKPAAPKTTRKFGDGGPRAQRTWVERQLLRTQRVQKVLGNLVTSLTNGKPPCCDVATVTYLTDVILQVHGVEVNLATLPADWKPKRATVNRSGVEIGALIGVKEGALGDAVFNFISADLFESAVVLAEDGKQNWLVKCSDGIVRTIRKMMVEPVTADGGTSEGTDQEVAPEEGELDDEDTDGTDTDDEEE